MRVSTCTSAVLALLLTATAAPAALTTESCLAAKQKAWGGLRKCEAGERAKALQSKPSDVAKCQTNFAAKITTINGKAADASVACRYGDNGDGTVTDYDTGLQWEKKDSDDGGSNYANPHDVDNTYRWSTFIKEDGTGFLDQLNGETFDGTTVTGCFAEHCDWRLPTVVELKGILLAPYPAPLPCGPDPCIDPIFGPTALFYYWPSTTFAGSPYDAWYVAFIDGYVGLAAKNYPTYVRAVRGGL